jgi:cytochrome c-type biogenesis protein
MEPQSVGLAMAFGAGLLSFLSPCVLPLVPSYASFLTGMTFDEMTEGAVVRRNLLLHGSLFVLGFSLVFIALGASAGLVGGLLRTEGAWIQRAGGLVLVVLGVQMLGFLKVPGLQRDWRVHLARKPTGYAGSVGVGVAFGAGWTPCVGPILGAILTLAAVQGTTPQAIGLLATYSAGLALPFLLGTLALGHFLVFFQRFRRWLPWVNRIGGGVLIVMGVLLLTGQFTLMAGILTRYTPEFLLDRL